MSELPQPAAPASAFAAPGGGSRTARVAKALGTRLAELIAVIVVLVVLTSLVVRLLPGDPAQAILGASATVERVTQLRAQLGLDRSTLEQLGTSLGDAFQGDLGTSLAQSRPVSEVLWEAFPVSLSILVLATVIALLAGIPLGLLPALRRSRALARLMAMLAVVFLSIPAFVVGLYLILFVAIDWGLAPAGGWGTGWPGNLRYAWLPALALSFVLIPSIVRAVQRSSIDALSEEYVEAARARGVGELAIATRHVLPNVLLPLITLVGFNASWLLAGTIVIEAVFGIPGFGQVVQSAVASRDYPLVVGATLFSGVFVILVNLATDLLQALADPRVRVRS